MRARDRLRLGAALAPELGPDAGEAEQRPIFLEREPDDVFLLRRRIWLGGVLGKTVRRHEAAVLRLLPAAQCGDDVLRMLVTGGPPVTNIRDTSSPHWRAWLKPENRCLVPFNSFAEYAPEPNPETKATRNCLPNTLDQYPQGSHRR